MVVLLWCFKVVLLWWYWYGGIGMVVLLWWYWYGGIGMVVLLLFSLKFQLLLRRIHAQISATSSHLMTSILAPFFPIGNPPSHTQYPREPLPF